MGDALDGLAEAAGDGVAKNADRSSNPPLPEPDGGDGTGARPDELPNRLSKSVNDDNVGTPKFGSRYAAKRSAERSGGVGWLSRLPVRVAADVVGAGSVTAGTGDGPLENALRNKLSSNALLFGLAVVGNANTGGLDVAADDRPNKFELDVTPGDELSRIELGLLPIELKEEECWRTAPSLLAGGVGGLANVLDVGMVVELLTSLAYENENALSYTLSRSFSVCSLCAG